ncbi:MAG: L-threonylcarbamoyladenylate synthase [Chitinophagaceae bacterium]
MITTQIGTDINKAITLLNANEVVAIPTETVYGLAGNALNNEAVAKIFEAKNRPFFNPLILHLASIEQIKEYAFIDEPSLQLATHFMPGPFTLLLKKKDKVPDLVTAGSNKVAIRIPNHPLTHKLLSQLNYPLAAPSANPFGYVSPVSAAHVLQGLQGKIKYILDGGNSTIGLESTIVEIENGEVLLHRAGGLAIEDIEQVIAKKVTKLEHHLKPQTSGQLKSHYATATDLLQGDIYELIALHQNKKIAILSFEKQYDGIDRQHQYILSPSGNLNHAAQHLFSTMRILDTMNYDIILAEIFPQQGLGIAINDRLKRAQVTEKD